MVLRVPAFQWLTAWSVKMEVSDQRGWNESPINADGLTSIKSGFPFQPMSYENILSSW